MPKTRIVVEEGSKEKKLKKQKNDVQHSDTNTSLPRNSKTSKTTKTEKKFTAKDFSFLSENEHFRYLPNSKKIGHAMITKEGDKTVALQYEIPSSDNEDTPKVRPLINIEEIEPFRGMHRFRAQTPETHTEMYAKRFISGKLSENGEEKNIQIACFSPSFRKNKPVFWGSIKDTPLFCDDLSKSEKKDLEKELKEIKPKTKGGDTLQVDPESVPQRDLITKRTPDQNTVMGESARDAYENFFDKMAKELHPHMKERLKRSFTADIKDQFYKNSHRPEWLHLKGWSLMPMNMNPQTKNNLGAAPKWVNTQMMILERTVKWFALNSPASLLTIKPKFEMLLDTELVKHIDFKVRIKIKERFVELVQSIDPFLAYPLFPKATDLAQGTAITYNLLNKVNPVSKQVVKGIKSKDNGVSNEKSSIESKTSNHKKKGDKDENEQQKIVEIEEIYNDLSEDDESDESIYYSEDSDYLDEEETESDDCVESDDLEIETSHIKSKQKISNQNIQKHGFFNSSSKEIDRPHDRNTRFRFK